MHVIFDFFIDLIFEPLVMAMGNLVLGFLGKKKPGGPDPSGLLVAFTGIATWALLGLLVVLFFQFLT